MNDVRLVSALTPVSNDDITYAYVGDQNVLPSGWVLCIDNRWVARTASGLREDFDSKEDALAFLTLLVSAGN